MTMLKSGATLVRHPGGFPAMAPVDVEAMIKNLNDGVTRVEQILPTLATKKDLEALAHQGGPQGLRDEGGPGGHEDGIENRDEDAVHGCQALRSCVARGSQEPARTHRRAPRRRHVPPAATPVLSKRRRRYRIPWSLTFAERRWPSAILSPTIVVATTAVTATIEAAELSRRDRAVADIRFRPRGEPGQRHIGELMPGVHRHEPSPGRLPREHRRRMQGA